MKKQVKKHDTGLTLIEFIVALVIAAFVAAMSYAYFSSALTESSRPIERLRQVSNLHQVMENIIADYNRLNQINLRYKWRSSTAYSLNSIVNPSSSTNNESSKVSNNGRYYKCTQAGTSGNSLPSWPVTEGLTGTVTDGGVVWKEEGYVWKPNTAYPANSIVVPVINNGHFYKGSGTSGGTEPTWPKIAGNTESDGGVTWTEVGSILDSIDPALLDNIKNNLTTSPGKYGSDYTVVTTGTKFIQFNVNTEVNAGASGTSSEKNILKVTIKNNQSNEILTQLFTIR